jgi:hypothetical protein
MRRLGLLILILLCLVSHSNQEPSYTGNYTTNITANFTGFQLGDDIVPQPPAGITFDCDDAIIYTYLYLKGAGYDSKIMYGFDPWAKKSGYYVRHVWIQVGKYVYDWGLPTTEIDFYKGHEITYRQLLNYALSDTR